MFQCFVFCLHGISLPLGNCHGSDHLQYIYWFMGALRSLPAVRHSVVFEHSLEHVIDGVLEKREQYYYLSILGCSAAELGPLLFMICSIALYRLLTL